MENTQSNQRLGTFVVTELGGEKVRSFIPPPLPPVPSIQMDQLQILLEQANQELGRLDGLASALPDLPLFLYLYVRKEALLSSQIEGTQSSLSDLMVFEDENAPGAPLNDVEEVSNYVKAISHGMKRVEEGFPISLRLIREIHEVLLSDGRGSEKLPGEFRNSQNWIGGTRPGNAFFVPPPPNQVMECMGQLEKFIHEKSTLPLLIRAGMIHVQFETIHPFLDGNGRVGRLLITLSLCAGGALQKPILYLSLYFKTHRQMYYDLLTEVRSTGNWEAWLEFFLAGVKETSEQAVQAARRIIALFDSDRKKIEGLGRSASLLRLHQYAQKRPIFSIAKAAKELEIAFPTAATAILQLEKVGILREITGKQRDRLYAYSDYLKILEEGTEPLK